MQAIPASYRDNAGYVFQHNNTIYRLINENFLPTYNKWMHNGLYKKLTEKHLLVSHTEVLNNTGKNGIVIQPQLIPTISYAYEWSFSMLQDAAICTLQNALVALQFDMILKDANTHNIQFLQGRPVLIDTLSFDNYLEGESWVAYRQFCECFLAPLVLMKYTNANMNKLLLAYPNGIPLAICKALLPIKARWNLNVYLHIIMASKVQSANNNDTVRTPALPKQKLITLLNGLKSFVQSLKIPNAKTTWDNYYAETILSKNYLESKKQIVHQFVDSIPFNSMVDLGANDGEFSMHYANKQKKIIALDEDINCIERLYNNCKTQKVTNVMPLINDLTTPSPAIGWGNAERDAITNRIQSDVCLALALIHHIAIANNVPLENIINYLKGISPYLVIEFVAKEDAKVQELLKHRKDIFDQYTLADFKKIISKHYQILQEQKVGNEHRWMFLLKRLDF
jgi:hypothetical protein